MDLTKKNAFFEGWSWFKLNNLGLALVTNLKFYTNVEKGLKLEVRKFSGLILTFAQVPFTGLLLGILVWSRVKEIALQQNNIFCLYLTHSFPNYDPNLLKILFGYFFHQNSL